LRPGALAFNPIPTQSGILAATVAAAADGSEALLQRVVAAVGKAAAGSAAPGLEAPGPGIALRVSQFNGNGEDYRQGRKSDQNDAHGRLLSWRP